MKRSPGVSFQVDPDLKVGEALPVTGENEAWWWRGRVEASSAQPDGVVRVCSDRNLFAEAVHESFYKHYPLILSPDVIWLTIAQGFGNHVNQNAQELRSKFVTFQDKKTLEVVRPTFVKGSPNNDWASVFPEFSKLIADNIGQDTVNLIECNFTTTTPVDRIVSHITLMDTVQQYFSYAVLGGCGLPSITLKGTSTDWQDLRAKAERLKPFELDWWLNELLPVLDQFVAASKGNADIQFWRSICNLRGASGSSEPITGWLQTFFPYLNNPDYDHRENKDAKQDDTHKTTKKRLIKNTCLGGYRKSYSSSSSNLTAATYATPLSECDRGVPLKYIPSGLSSAPFTYTENQKSYKMEFVGGITSLVQHPDTLALEPHTGWAVLDG